MAVFITSAFCVPAAVCSVACDVASALCTPSPAEAHWAAKVVPAEPPPTAVAPSAPASATACSAVALKRATACTMALSNRYDVVWSCVWNVPNCSSTSVHSASASASVMLVL